MVGYSLGLRSGLMVLVEKHGKLGVWHGDGREAIRSMNVCQGGL